MQQLLQLQGKAGNQAVRTLLGSGRPLPDPVREEIETRFGTDFRNVRIHDHTLAHRSAKFLRAKAFTYGSDIVFGAGRFMPGRQEGRYLLTHELAHVVQQSRGIGTLAPDDQGLHEASAANAGKAFIGGTGPVVVMGSTGVGIARTPEDETEPDLHKTLKIGETREYRDLGGTAGKASRPTADVFVIETNLRAGQSTIRSDYQTKALPTPEGNVIPLGEGGFEKLHAIGPLLGHESPHGILYGPFRLNRHLMEHGIETYLSQLRDLLPPGALLRLRVTVQRELGTGRYQGHEFLKSISYSVDQLKPSGLHRPVFRQEIVVDRPQDPNTTYDIGEPRLLINDPLKKVISPASKEKRRQRVPDILPARDQKAARKLFDELTNLKEQFDTLRQRASNTKAESTRIDSYTNELGKALTSIKTPDRMTQDELENLRQLRQDLLKLFPELRGRMVGKTFQLEAKPRAIPRKVESPKQSQTTGPQPRISPTSAKVPPVGTVESPTKPSDTIGKVIPGPSIKPSIRLGETKADSGKSVPAATPKPVRAPSAAEAARNVGPSSPTAGKPPTAETASQSRGRTPVFELNPGAAGKFEITPLPPNKIRAGTGVPDMTPVTTPPPVATASKVKQVAGGLMGGGGGAVGIMLNEIGINAMQQQEIDKAAHAVSELQPQIDQASASGKWIIVVTVFDYHINLFEHVMRDRSDVKHFHRAYLLIGDTYEDARYGTKEEREATGPVLRAGRPGYPPWPAPQRKDRLYADALWKVVPPVLGTEKAAVKPVKDVSGRWKRLGDPNEETMTIIASHLTPKVKLWSKQGMRTVVSVRWDPRQPVVDVFFGRQSGESAARESRFEVIGPGSMVEDYVLRADDGTVLVKGCNFWFNNQPSMLSRPVIYR